MATSAEQPAHRRRLNNGAMTASRSVSGRLAGREPSISLRAADYSLASSR